MRVPPVNSLRAPSSSVPFVRPGYIFSKPCGRRVAAAEGLFFFFFLNDGIVSRLLCRIMHRGSAKPNYAHSGCLIQPTPTASCWEREAEYQPAVHLRYTGLSSTTVRTGECASLLFCLICLFIYSFCKCSLSELLLALINAISLNISAGCFRVPWWSKNYLDILKICYFSTCKMIKRHPSSN